MQKSLTELFCGIVSDQTQYVYSRSDLRECVVVDNCATLMRPDGTLAVADSGTWEIGAETGGRREFYRRKGRTMISLPVIYSGNEWAAITLANARAWHRPT